MKYTLKEIGTGRESIFACWCFNPDLGVDVIGVGSIQCAGWMVPTQIRDGQVTLECDVCRFVDVCAFDFRAVGVNAHLPYVFRGGSGPQTRGLDDLFNLYEADGEQP